MASLIGFVNQAGDGAAGIESGMNSILKGQDGRYVYANGIYAEIPGSQQEMVQPKPGNSIRLTIELPGRNCCSYLKDEHKRCTFKNCRR